MSHEFWIEKGRTYFEEFNKKTVIQKLRYLVQEQVLIGALNKVARETEVREILDAGCGFGRITRILCEVFPYSRVFGIDISDDQLREARRAMPRVAFWTRSVTVSQRAILNDLTVACELLMHIAPTEIEKAILFLTRGEPKFIVTVDWWTEDEVDIWAAREAGFCFLHDYEELFRARGYELVREKKIPFVDQKLRVWGKRE